MSERVSEVARREILYDMQSDRYLYKFFRSHSQNSTLLKKLFLTIVRMTRLFSFTASIPQSNPCIPALSNQIQAQTGFRHNKGQALLRHLTAALPFLPFAHPAPC